MSEPSGDRAPVAEVERTILAFGAHEFSRRAGNEALRDAMLELLPAGRRRICLLPTASGDPREQIGAFRASLGGTGNELSELSLFRLEAEPVGLREHLLGQDLIYVGGGSMLNLLAIWRAHGLDRDLREAWERGVVLAGPSAGAMCWFEGGITRSSGRPRVAHGLGLLPGSACVHYDRDHDRRAAYLAAVGSGELPAGYALCDQAGIVFRGAEPAEALSGRPEAAVWRVEPDGDGPARERRVEASQLTDPRPAIDEPGSDVRELRELRGKLAGSRRS